MATTDPLVTELLELVDSDAYQIQIEDFARANCHMFCRQPGQEGTTDLSGKCEQSHEEHVVYAQYTDMIESMLGEFLKGKGLSQEELYKLLAEKNTYDNSTIEGSRLRALVASFDYNEFLSLMLSYSDESYEDHDGQVR
mmetsp:Transcript_41771/g.79791  ORF Transcript_41771/g.79791 Transcript_41771/m.79791 type:complete len:139 (+) Transcript_41771:222-638(+)|eukprot:CAMPEP_0114297426 /NCGR_PEP_ID=MMETSP0059-20121206/11848_1 /TAXON_ID=36894 /ORGANISM="Pyramimonas parkeae, Strain CCMP726" /LENGTH=138 /DNA_ID=CAMNT_0001419659 /DNA_START=292 /DNA_END=708 /DNA_ORIENTATION=-